MTACYIIHLLKTNIICFIAFRYLIAWWWRRKKIYCWLHFYHRRLNIWALKLKLYIFKFERPYFHSPMISTHTHISHFCPFKFFWKKKYLSNIFNDPNKVWAKKSIGFCTLFATFLCTCPHEIWKQKEFSLKIERLNKNITYFFLFFTNIFWIKSIRSIKKSSKDYYSKDISFLFLLLFFFLPF